MDSRERISAALHLEEPDRISIQDSFWTQFHEKMRKHLKLSKDQNVYEHLGMNEIGGSSTPGWCPRSGYGKVISETKKERIVMSDWGYTQKDLKTGASVPQFLEHPVKSPDELDDYLATWDAPDDEKRWGDIPKTVKEVRERLFITPSGLEHYESAWRVIGFERLLQWIYKEPRALKRLLKALTDYFVGVGEYAMDLGADGFWFYGDIADNHGPFMNKRTYRKIFYPYHRRTYRAVRKKGGLVVLHTDGDVRPILPDFIEAGITALQPIDAIAGMNVIELKPLYGDKIAFIGNIDNSNTLPFGSVQDVKREVMEKMAVAGQGGGYVCGSSHSVPDSVPIENYLTLVETVRKYGRYQ
jgi:uroporphyrinogen-III decarboxylase